ncbi:TVP38/TMEM64 family protein [Kitasatospora sp. NBC_01539]|uniref:TVP38/TMEM64 family protein n=1 Tax=Kitasatospora sp. NBC_01539 TaxID=2903577 RepID=UPI0038601214
MSAGRARLRLALLVVLLAAAAGSLLLWSPADALRSADGPWQLPLALAVYALGTLAFVPKPALNAAAGLLLGVAQGLPLAVAGTTLGAAAAFVLGRTLGRDALRPLLRTRAAAALDRRLTDRGFRSVLMLRLVPGVPFQAANYACAVSGVRPGPYLGATALGVLPGTAAYVAAGAGASSPTSAAFLVPTGLIVLLSAASGYSLWRSRRAAAAATAAAGAVTAGTAAPAPDPVPVAVGPTA